MLLQCEQWAREAAQPLPRDMASCIQLVGDHFDRRLLDVEFQQRLQELKQALQPLVSCLAGRILWLNQYIGTCIPHATTQNVPRAAAGQLLFPAMSHIRVGCTCLLYFTRAAAANLTLVWQHL